MAQLILIVVVVAWIAVLLPPMLRSRVENRPNSSVTDFRRQLTRLQNTATPPRGAARAMGRPLAQSPLSRPVAAGRPNQPVLRSGVTRHATSSELAAARSGSVMAPAPQVDDDITAPRFRSHGDPTGDARRPTDRQRPQQRREAEQYAPEPRGQRRSGREMDRFEADVAADFDGRRRSDSAAGVRRHGDPTGGQRRPASDRSGGHRRLVADRGGASDVRVQAKQRRMNIVFVLGLVTVCSLFLAATTSSEFMVYAFAFSFLALVGYVYMLRQARVREEYGSSDTWSDFR